MSHFTNDEAKEIWKSRWRGVPIKKLVAIYGADPRRFYEVWREEENEGPVCRRLQSSPMKSLGWRPRSTPLLMSLSFV